jgi:hypothetical protein
LALATGCASPPDLARAPVATPPTLAAFGADPAVTTATDWTTRRAPLLRQAFQDQIYGRMPDLGAATIEKRENLSLEDVGGASVEQWTVRLGDGEPARRFHMIVAIPASARGPVPLVIAELFCGNRAALPGRPEAVFEDPAILPPECNNAAMKPLVKLIFGQRIDGPPVAEVTARGYAVAFFYPGEIVPDEKALAPAALATVQPEVPAAERAGALAVWAVMYSKALDVLALDPRIDAARVAAWGHSRHGKAALLAGAFDPRFAAIISHQSGRGGASLTRSSAGETVAQITRSYGYWFGAAYARQTGPVTLTIDQHQLVALIAPRPVLLGSGMGDGWSDPAGAFRAAQGADPVYRLLGSNGLTVSDMEQFDPAAGIAFYTRPGGHGVTTEDWQAFEQFLDVALKK